jgi:hypothetical protein
MGNNAVARATEDANPDELASARSKIALLTHAGNNLHRLIIDLGPSHIAPVIPEFRSVLEDWLDVVEGRFPPSE